MYQYLLPILAVVIGSALVILTRKNTYFNFKLLLAFSGAFLLALTLFELLPEVYAHLDPKETGLYIMFGILIQIILEFFSKGAEHGHVHTHTDDEVFPWALFISLCIHSFLEGFPIHEHNDMVYGVLVHKIPIATVLMGFLLHSKFSKFKIIAFITLFALMTPLGTYLSNHVSIFSEYISVVNGIVIGIFLHISTTILFESGEGHKFNLTKLVAIVLGIAAAYVI
ncbi:ZIP family metal transporter [Bizionia argentinensis JUB59]|uniref:ZIP family metal transporter n=1 Tax=Bizionia argentinensis JUB59 TaxID=1046627 RepID=G2ECA3_9FLAO|nr:ZIP family metal transporter [Bizionia argentinensis]EGV43922.1 ZIP family metal transporter [Bizionia argentinensis JUB59]